MEVSSHVALELEMTVEELVQPAKATLQALRGLSARRDVVDRVADQNTGDMDDSVDDVLSSWVVIDQGSCMVASDLA